MIIPTAEAQNKNVVDQSTLQKRLIITNDPLFQQMEVQAIGAEVEVIRCTQLRPLDWKPALDEVFIEFSLPCQLRNLILTDQELIIPMTLAHSQILLERHRGWIFSFTMKISDVEGIGNQSGKVELSL